MSRKKKKSKLIYFWYSLVFCFFVYLSFYLPSYKWAESIFNIAISLVVTTSLASFVGCIVEDRNWTRFVSFLVKPLVSWAGLPAISASSMLTSFFSSVAANTMLVSAYNSKELTRIQMRLSAMFNSYMNYIYHTLKIAYPVIATIGVVGILYFGLLFSTGFLVLILAVLYSKYIYSSVNIDVFSDEISVQRKKTNTWKNSIVKSLKRTRSVVNRMLLIAIPLFVFFSYLAEIGFFTFTSKDSVFLNEFFPPQAFAVVAAMMGGMLSAASVAAGFIKSGDLDSVHVLLALFAGNVISMPIRTLRRSLPAAMSVFSSKDAIAIVLLNQASRLLMTILLIVILIVCIHYDIIT